MNICLITPRMSVAKGGVLVGGSTVSMVNLARGLAARGHRVHVAAGYCSADDIAAGAKILPDGVEQTVIRVRAPRCTSLYGVEFLARARRAFRGLRPAGFDIINLHSGFAPYCLAARAASRQLDLPAVHTLYCPVRRSLPVAWSRRALSEMSALVAISDNVARSVRELVAAPPRLSVIPPGVNTDAFTPARDGQAFRRRHGLGADQPLLLFVGNLDPMKGLDVLLSSFARVVESFPDARLVVTLEFKRAGSDRASARIARQIEQLMVGDRIIQLGFVGDMPEVMAAADALVIPFRGTDGPSDYPLPLLEAMSAGTPVICTRVGGVPELVEHGVTGWLAAPEDVQGMTDAIIEVLGGRDRAAAAAQAARRAMEERFSIASVAERTERLFQEVLSHRP